MANILKIIPWKRIGIVSAAIVTILFGLGLIAVLYINSENGKAHIVQIANERLASEQSIIHISKIEGDILSDFHIPLVRLSDQSGPWLEFRDINMKWSPPSLMNGKVLISALNIEEIDFLRPPLREEEVQDNEPFSIPSLPVDIDVTGYSVENLKISDALTDVASEFNIKGALKLTENDGIIVSSKLLNTSGHSDAISIDISMINDASNLKADITLDAPRDGFFNSLSPSLPNEDMSLVFNGNGPLSNWSGVLKAALEGQSFAEGQITHNNEEWLIHADLDVRPFVDPSITDLVGDNNTLDIKYSNTELNASLISKIARVNIKGIENYDFLIDIINPEPINQMISPNYLNATKIDGNIRHLNDKPQISLNLNDMIIGIDETIETNVNGQFSAVLDDQVIHLTSKGHLNKINGAAVESVSGLLQEGIDWNLETNFDQATSISELEGLSIFNQNFQINGSGKVNIDTAAINVDINGIVENLANIANRLEIDQDLSGGLIFNTNVISQGNNSPIDATLSMVGNNMNLGDPVLSELIGVAPTFNLELSRSTEGAIKISETMFEGDFLKLTAEAEIEENQNIKDAVFALSFSNIEKMESLDSAQLNGNIDIIGHLKGNINSPSLLVETGFNALTIQSIELQNIKAELNAENIIDDLDGAFKVSGNSNFGDIAVDTDFTQNDETYQIPSLDIIFGPYQAKGAFEISAGKPIIGELDVLTHNIEQTEKSINGTISAHLNLLEESATQQIEFNGEIRDFFILLNENDLLTLAAANISANALLTDEEPIISLEANLSKLMHPSFQSEEIQLELNQQINGFGYNLNLNGTEEMPYIFDINGSVLNIEESGQLISIALSGSIDETPISLVNEAKITVIDDEINVAPFNLLFGDGNIIGNFDKQQKNIDASVLITNTDIKPILVFAPELPLTGMLNGKINISSDKASLLSTFDYNLTNLMLKQQNKFVSYEDAKITTTGTFNEQISELSGSLNLDDYFNAIYSAKLPVDINPETYEVSLPEDQNIQGQLKWNGEIEPVWPLLQLIDHDLRGILNTDIILSGTYSNPDLDGTINMTDGRYENMQTGFVADDIDMAATIKDRQFSLDRFNANDGAQGIISANADINIAPDFSYTARADLNIKSAELMRQPELQLKASSNLNFEKGVEKTSLSGDIIVENGSIGAVDQGSVSIAELDVTEINTEGTNHTQNDQKDALGPIDLDLNLLIPNQLFVTSYGLDSEWEADLQISGTSEEPIVGGTANLIRGFFEFSGKRFELMRGNFSFPNDKSNDPIIEIAAEHAMSELTANLRIYGKASNPKLALSSTPYLPENEVLARILFGTSVAELTAVEAVQLASAVYSLSNGGGQGMLGGIRRAIGVDRLSIENDNGREYGTTITGGKYLTNNVYVEVSTAPATGETATSVEIDLTRNLSLVTRRTMDHDNNLSVRWFWDY